MLKRHEVEILLKAGHPKTEVARLAGVSLCSVKRIAEETPVVHVDDAAEREKLKPFVGKYVQASGTVFERKGTRAIVIAEIKEIRSVQVMIEEK